MGDRDITTYDDAFRTLLAICPKLIIPVVNELFGTDYESDEEVVLRQNERFLNVGGERKKRVTDSCFSIRNRDYHLEVQSTSDNSIAFRMMEYDMMLAMEGIESGEDNIRIVFPNSGVIYLRKNIRTPEKICITFDTPGGINRYECKVIRVADYSVDEIFEKRLYFFIPFVLFIYEDRFREYNEDEELLKELAMTYESLRSRLFHALVDEGYGAHIYDLFVELIGSVAGKLAQKYDNVKEGAMGPMYGNILETKTMKAYNMQKEAEAMMTEAEKKAQKAEADIRKAEEATHKAETQIAEEKEKSIEILIDILSKEGHSTDRVKLILKEKYELEDEKADAVLTKYWK